MLPQSVKYICLQSWSPLRKEMSSASEMVSAMLFGETCEVLEFSNDWMKVRCDFDGYEGWVPTYYLDLYEGQQWHKVLGAQSAVLTKDTFRIHLSAGSYIPEGDVLTLRGEEWKLTVRDSVVPSEPWQLALGFLHVPYLWGGRSDCGLDCSGLTQIIFKIKGLKIPRDASQQFEIGTEIAFGDHKPNDLAFFANENGKITHVGILSPRGIIHASGRVRKDQFTEAGIADWTTGKITHKLAGIKRMY